ncbi:hypothetical protein B0H14DRAFT_2726315, partial [Mycena olivaceomarginata]
MVGATRPQNEDPEHPVELIGRELLTLCADFYREIEVLFSRTDPSVLAQCYPNGVDPLQLLIEAKRDCSVIEENTSSSILAASARLTADDSKGRCETDDCSILRPTAPYYPPESFGHGSPRGCGPPPGNGMSEERTLRFAHGNLTHTWLPLKGEQPTLNDWESFVIDHQRERLYSYGGVRPYDKAIAPTSDFHCLDLKTMEWRNLCPLLRFCPLALPFRTKEDRLEVKKLPALMEPASALISLSGGTYMFLFGGYDPESQAPTANLIAIDLDLLIWWYADVCGTPIVPRMSATMVAIKNRLFIFGGRTQWKDDSPAIATYSIAIYDPQSQWTWAISDEFMPPETPPLGYGIQAIPIDDGEKILLTRGWVDNTEPFNLSGDTIILFHTENYTSESATGTTGSFPSGIRWHLVGSIAGPHLTPSVAIAAWVTHNDMDDVLVPEIWQYFLPPVGRICCLNLRETFWDLKLDFQSFVTAGTRMLLFGSEEGHDDEAEVQDNIERCLPRWDVAIEISGMSGRGESTAAGQDNKGLDAPPKRKGAAKPAAKHQVPAAAKPKGKVSDTAASASAKAKGPIKRGSAAALASRSRFTSVGGSVGPDSSEKHDDGDQHVLGTAAAGDMLYCVCKTKYDEAKFMIACCKCDELYHTQCVDMSDLDVNLVDQFFCPPCIQKTPNLLLKTTYRLRCRYGLDHPEPDSPEACHKPARGAFSKYCSPECGFNNMKKRIDTFTEKGGKKELLWDSVKDAQKREAVVIVHEVVPVVEGTEGCMKNTDPVLIMTTRIKPPAMVKVEWELTSLNAKLDQVLTLREDLQAGLKIVFWRARLLELARERAERVGQCGWDQRLCFSADEWAEFGAAVLDSYGEEDDMQVGAENWWCGESEQCERHAGWQAIRANDITKEKEKEEEALFRQTTRERQIRKRIEDIVEPLNRSCVGPTGAPLKASNANAMDGDRKKGKKRKNPSY